MSFIDYGDFEYCEDETGQTDGQLYSKPSIAYQDDDHSYTDQNNDHDSESEEDGSVRNLNHSSGDDEDYNPNENLDIDEYADFYTDLAKYQYDQLRWHQIPNPRKYDTGKKKQDKPKHATKPQKRKDPKAQISFDTRGQLWYSYLKNGIYVSGTYMKDLMSTRVC